MQTKKKLEQADVVRIALLLERKAQEVERSLPSDSRRCDVSEVKKEEDIRAFVAPDKVIDSVTRNAARTLVLIREALKRLQDDEYGDCIECGDEISEKRLNAYPEATNCLRCAEQAEAGTPTKKTSIPVRRTGPSHIRRR